MQSDTLVRDAAFYKRFFSIWSMLVLYNIITLGVNLADNVMIGAYSEIAMSGVSAVNQIQFVFQQLMMGVGDGIEKANKIMMPLLCWEANTGASAARMPYGNSCPAHFWSERVSPCSCSWRLAWHRKLFSPSSRPTPPSVPPEWSTCAL